MFGLTAFVDFIGAGAALWLALYLPGRGLSKGQFWRAVGVLLCLSGLLQSGYISLYATSTSSGAVRAVILVAALALWNDMSQHALPDAAKAVHKWRAGAIYIFSLLTVLVLLAAHTAFVEEPARQARVARIASQPALSVFAAFLIIASASILFSILLQVRARDGIRHRYFQLASVLVVAAAAFELVAMIGAGHLPRWIPEGILLASIAMLAVWEARSRTRIERRAAWRDLRISALAVCCLSAIYALLAWLMGVPALGMSLVAGLAIVTHSIYDRVRDYLERQALREQNAHAEAERRSASAPAVAEQAPLRVREPDLDFVSIVEYGLRHLTDCISLGRSSLSSCLGVAGETHIQLGKAVQQQLIQAIEALRPGNDLSKEPLPRDCYNYVILHDAYWEGVPNNQIMSRLQISEGTFHRMRRAAVRAVARSLLEIRDRQRA